MTWLSVLGACCASGCVVLPPSPDPAPRVETAATRADEVRFAALGDTGRGDAGQYRVAHALAAKCARDGCDFVQLLGDNLYTSELDATSFVELFEKPYSEVSAPFFVALGNHDYGTRGAGMHGAMARAEIAYAERTKRWALPARYYVHPVGPVTFVTIDSNAAMFGRDDAQRRAIHAALADADGLRVVFGHHPMRSNGRHGDAGHYEGLPPIPIASGDRLHDFLDDEVCGVADAYIAGHDHNRQWLVPTCRGTELVVAGAGAATTPLEGEIPAWFSDDTLGFVYGRATADALTLEMVDGDGITQFTRTIVRAPPHLSRSR